MATTLTFDNQLNQEVVVYSSSSDGSQTGLDYLGTLTQLIEVAAQKSQPYTPGDDSVIVFIVANQKDDSPIVRFQYFSFEVPETPYEITQADVDSMTQSYAFVQYMLYHMDDALIKQFDQTWDTDVAAKDATKLIDDINAFFAGTTDYKKCTYVSYSMAIAHYNRELTTKEKGVSTNPEKLVDDLGFAPLPFFPELTIKDVHFKTETKEMALALWGTLHLSDIPGIPGWDNVANWFDKIDPVCLIVLSPLNLEFAYYFTTKTWNIPISSSKSLKLTKPELKLSYSPIFKFGLIELIGDLSFKLWDTDYDATLSATLDSEELNFAVDLKSENMFTCPIAKGFHVDEFGIEMGMFFKPAGFDFGVSGKFHIGEESQNIQLEDDEFAVVLNIQGEAVEPMYLSFYVPKLDINELVEIFTNTSPNINIPVSLSDLSFYYAPDAVVLPDGTLADMGLGCSAAIDLFGFDFYAMFKITFGTGIAIDAQCNPIKLGSIVSITGDGKKVTQNVDKNGNPIKNNEIATKSADRQQPSGTPKTLVNAGGPVVHVSSSASPYVHMDIDARFLDVVGEKIVADIGNSGVTFNLKKDGLITSDSISFTMKSWEHCEASFTFGIDKEIPLPFTGNLHLQTEVETDVTVQYKSNTVAIIADIQFLFEGLQYTLASTEIDVNILKLSDLISKIENKIESTIKNLFGDLWNDGKELATKVGTWVKSNIITGINDLMAVFKDSPFNLNAKDSADVMNSLGYGADVIATGLKDVYGESMNDAAVIMKGVGVAGDATVKGLSSAYNASTQAIAEACHYAGYGVDEVAKGFNELGTATDVVGDALKSTYNLSKDAAESALKQAGYAADAVSSWTSSAFKTVSETAKKVVHYLDPSHW
ncbi:MAG: phage tail tape measure protein [Moorea sp. SIOASIH]|uniref:hypothetical protein n=1 Tax=Moorena sp. SIOASIH TaxID=2607817 RepID=UPI0013B6B205|nr:hypothetical protein [Moorena sp. SIOASIH]NEO40005.1 phage tail tape measure protein [Moorena sp. SIOASIH]